MANNNGGAWPYHLYSGTKPELKGSYVKCATSPCRMHAPSEHVMASSAEDACRQAYKGSSYSWKDNPKVKEQIEDWALVGQTPELAYANSNYDDNTKLELARPGDRIFTASFGDGMIVPGYPAGAMNVLFGDGSIRKFDDIRDSPNTMVTLQSAPTSSRMREEKGKNVSITTYSSESLDGDDRKINLGVFDYPENSPYSCCLNIDGAEYYVRKMHRDVEEEDVDFDDYKASCGGCYKLMPINLAANRLTTNNAITISGDDLKKKMANKDSNWEYTLYSNEGESEYSVASRRKTINTRALSLRDEIIKDNREIKDLETKTRNVPTLGLKLNAMKNKTMMLRKRLRKLSDMTMTPIIPKKKDIDKWLMHSLF